MMSCRGIRGCSASKDGRASQRPVKTGLHGNSQIEITEGLAAGDIAIPQSSGVLNGQRVRPVLQ